MYEITAEWDGEAYRAMSPDRNVWVSADGDEWFYDLVGGERVAGTPFASTCILLIGGPRDAEIVA